MTKLFTKKNFRRPLLLGAVLGLTLFGAAAPPKIFSQPAPATYRTANRWLIIVENSRAMEPRARAVFQLTSNLLISGMNGQLRPGDTLGLWTFNSELRAGEFSLQTWSPEKSKSITEHVGAFLAQLKYKNRPSSDRVFPAMNTVISNSEFITVLLISSGDETFRGTPFDAAINAIHKKWQSQQEKARLPFVTMLRAENGHITDFEVALPAAPLQLPPLPPELLITNSIVQEMAAPKPAPQPPPLIGPNLIVHGKKSDPETGPSSNSPPAVILTTTVSAGTNASAVKTNPATALAISNAVPASLAAVPIVSASNTPIAAASKAGEESSGNEKFFWIAGVIFAGLAAGLARWLIRRSRPQAHVSLITRSLERDKK